MAHKADLTDTSLAIEQKIILRSGKSTMSVDSANSLFSCHFTTREIYSALKKLLVEVLVMVGGAFWGETIAFGQTAQGQENTSIMILCLI